MAKSEILAMEVNQATMEGIPVVTTTKFLGVQMGEVRSELEFGAALMRFRYTCITLSKIALPMRNKIILLHTWAYPSVFNVAEAIPATPEMTQKLRKYV